LAAAASLAAAAVREQGNGAPLPVGPSGALTEGMNPDGVSPLADPPQFSVARLWDEQLLGAIRIDIPKPPAHARNLFHLSVAMWDAWAAFAPAATGYLVREKHSAADTQAARREAISYAAYRLLKYRFPPGYFDVDGKP